MKKTIIKAGIAVVMIIATYISCNKKSLDIPYALPSEETSFATENDFRTTLIGVYATITDFYASSGGGRGGGFAGEARLLPGDELTVGDNTAFENFSGLNPGTAAISQNYTSAYTMIGRANTLLEKLASATGVFTTPNLQNTIKGEALFLRAWCHYMLWNMYGTAPVRLERVTQASQLLASSSKGTELLDASIKDLQEAAGYLPTSWDAGNLGRVTSNSANGLLGKCLTFRGTVNKSAADYQAALTAFNKIGAGVKLVPNFGDNFDFNFENNAESLFEFQAGIAPVNQNPWLANDFGNLGVSGTVLAMYDTTKGRNFVGPSYYRPTTKYKNIFEAGDPRLPISIVDNTIGKYVLKGKNAYDPKQGAISVNNWRIFRFADVVLLKAEATLQSGGSTAAAIGFINEVRTRARNMVPGGLMPADFSTAETDKAKIMQWIMDERLRELGAEGERWFDLRRWHLAGFITLNNAFFSSTAPQFMGFEGQTPPNKYIFFPIPSSETDKNKNVAQNLGY